MVPTRRSQRGTATGRWRWQRAVAVVGRTTLWRWLAGPRCGGGWLDHAVAVVGWTTLWRWSYDDKKRTPQGSSQL
ncbi:MAG: hypothetical protein AAFP02_23040 [Bacteroidota bacterium]